MAKTNPIGVRFDKDLLELIKKEQKLESPQKVLNWLLDNYGATKSWLYRMSETAQAIKKQSKSETTSSSTEPKIKGKGWFDEYRRKKTLGLK